MLTAWGDESGSQPDRDPDTYLIAAALCDEDDARTSAKQWKRSACPRRKRSIGTAAAPTAGTTSSRPSQPSRWQGSSSFTPKPPSPTGATAENAWSICSPTWPRCRAATSHSNPAATWTPAMSTSCRKFRAPKVITSSLRVNHAVGMVEPALWVADIVCGAVVQSRVGNPSYLAKLAGAVDLRQI